MKKVFLSILCIALVHQLQAQTINDVPFSKLEDNYVKIVGTHDESDVYIDFGSKHNAARFNNRLAAPDQRNIIKSAEGHEMIFSSMVDALNFMDQNGYQFVQAYSISSGSHSLRYYIMKRKSN